MATILRYVKHLRKIHGAGWRVVVGQPHIEVTGVKLGLYSHQPIAPDLTKSYATRTAAKPTTLVYGSETNIQNLEAQIRRSGRINKIDIEKCLAEVQGVGTIPSLEALLLIRYCGKTLIDVDPKESIQLVQEIWDTLERLSIPMDVSHYNALLNVYLEKDHDFSPSKFLSTMQEKSIEPNRVTYQRLISSYCRKGDIAEATKVLEVMSEKGLPLCENIFNSLIIGHSEANDMESAMGILKVMENAGITASADTYAALLYAYAKRGDMESIKATLNKLENSETFLLDTHLMEIIYTLTANGHVTQAEELSEKLPTDIASDTVVSRLLVKLVSLNQIPLALKILKQTATYPMRRKIRSTFIIKTALKNPNITKEDIIKICCFLEDEMQNGQAFQLATYHSLISHQDPTMTISLMKAWAEKGAEIRDHYFWPLLRNQAKANNYDGILEILKSMIEDFKIIPSLATLRDYTIPYMFGTWENIIERLRPLKILRNDILTAIVDRSLFEKKLRNTAMIMTTYPTKYPKDIILPHLAEALSVRNDFKSFVTVLRLLNHSEDSSDIKTPIELVDAALEELLKITPCYRHMIVANLLEEMAVSGLSISPEMGKQLKGFFKDNVIPELDELIEKLASSTLTEVPMTAYNPFLIGDKPADRNGSYSPDTVELRRAFAYYAEKKDDQKVLELLRRMESVGYESAAVYAQAIEIFCEAENVEAAEEFIGKMKMTKGKLDNRKIIKYSTLLVKKDRFADAMTYITDQPYAEGNAMMSRGLMVAIRKLLDTTAEAKHVENLHQIFNLLVSKNLVKIDNYSLGPLVKIHILRNDLKTAVETFERACNDYKCTPYKNILSTALIEAEDANSLQKLTDLCTGIHGESNALVDLAFVFLECGRLRQAHKIFETSGAQIYNEKITNIIHRAEKLNKLENLEHLVTVTKGVTRMDRAHLFTSLLMVYDAKDDWERGLALWTKMQEDDVNPTNEFLNRLSQLLKRNNQEVPFVQYDSSPVEQTQNPLTRWAPRRLKRADVYDQFSVLLARRDFNTAEEVANLESASRSENIERYTRLIYVFLHEEKLDKALHITKKVLRQYFSISRMLFTQIGKKLLKAKRFKDIDDLGSIMDDNLKDYVKYYKVKSSADISRHGLKSYIEKLVIEISNDVAVRAIDSKINYGAMAHRLLADPSCLKQFETFANDLEQKGVDRGLHVLWNYHFINNNTTEEEKLWNEFIVNSKLPLFRPIIEVAKENKDVELMKRLENRFAEHTQLSINAQCKLMSGLISVYNAVDRYDDGLELLKDATKRFRIGLLSFTVLRELKRGLERSGKTFPYTLDQVQSNAEEEENQQQQNVRFELAKL